MGNDCCSSRNTFEDYLDNFFEKLPLNNELAININNYFIAHGYCDTVTKLINDKNKSGTILLLENKVKKPSNNLEALSYIKEESFVKTLPQTNFQDFIYKYLIVKDYDQLSLNYFNSLYTMIKHSFRYPLMKLIILLLCGKDESSEQVIIENFSYYSLFMTRLNNSNEVKLKSVKIISNEDLSLFLYYYLKSITMMTCQTLMRGLMKDSYNTEIKKKYDNIWKDKIIEAYIDYTFIIKGDKRTHGKIIEKFVKENISLLSDSKQLRRDFTDFAIEKEHSIIDQANEKKLLYTGATNFN